MEIDGQPVIFCFIAWMSNYCGAIQTDVPIWAGKRALQGRTRSYFLGEVYNFLPLKHRNLGYRLFGDVQAGFNTPRLGGDDTKAAGVTVIWCAADPRDGDRVKMVGWYKNATVFRSNQEIRKHLFAVDTKRIDNKFFKILCDPADGYVLHPEVRPSLPHTPGRSAAGRWHSRSKSWKGDDNLTLKSAVKRWFNTDWDAVVRRQFRESTPITRQKVLTTIRERQGQSRFRRQLLNAYKDACAITGCDFVELLDACHLDPASNPISVHSVENGILLRTDLHTLFDLGYLAIEPLGQTVWISPAVRDPIYVRLAGKKLRLPEMGYSGPGETQLISRWKARKSEG